MTSLENQKEKVGLQVFNWLTPTDRATRCVTTIMLLCTTMDAWLWSTGAVVRRSTVDDTLQATIDLPSQNYS